MEIGLFAPLAHPFATGEYLETLARGAEERGFAELWVAEHLVLFDDYASSYPYAQDGKIPARPENGFLEPFTSLSYLAAHSREIRLGTGICLLPQRNPAYTAKEVANVDVLSGGRLDLGLGVGWLAEEFAVANVPFERRGARTRSYLEVCKRLWCDEVSEWKDEFYELPACRMAPKPVQRPHPPIYFGGESDAALRRVADVGQGWYGFNRDPDAAGEGIARLRQLLDERERPFDDVRICISPYLQPVTPDWIPRYAELGVDQVILMCAAADCERLERTMDELTRYLAAC